MEFPRLLVVTSNNFNLVTGGGITLTNLFRGWPEDRIANLHEDSQPADESVCRNFFRLTSNEIRLIWPFAGLISDSAAGEARSSGANGGGSLVRISQRVFGDGVPRRFTMTAELKAWLDAFQPEVIYSFLGSMVQIRVTAALTAHYSAPLVIHVMDDWPAVVYRHGLLGPRLRRTVLAEFASLLRQSAGRLAICQEMCEEYRRRFGYTFLPFQNAIDISEWSPFSRKSWTSGSPFIVRYAGSILKEAQRDALLDICAAVANLRERGDSIEMWIHAPAAQRRYLEEFSFSGLHLEDSPDPSGIVELLSSADLLVLPFNFDERSEEYLRFSMPTKVPAYMVSGVPILLYGPESIAPVRYALREGWGYVVFRPGVDLVQTAMRKLMTERALREMHGRRAKIVAAERHDAGKVRAEFHDVLASAARGRVSV